MRWVGFFLVGGKQVCCGKNIGTYRSCAAISWTKHTESDRFDRNGKYDNNKIVTSYVDVDSMCSSDWFFFSRADQNGPIQCGLSFRP